MNLPGDNNLQRFEKYELPEELGEIYLHVFVVKKPLKCQW